MEAFITLATNDSYATGACVLAHSLRRTNTTKQLCVMITSTVTEDMRTVLHQLFDHVELVDLFHSGDETNLRLLARQDLGSTFTKLHCWRLTQYTKAVFMDADTLVIRNIDDLFEREELSAAPDPGWPDCFNSGVFVFRPSLETYRDLVNFAVERGSFDGADQGLLNRYFSDWATKDIARHLPFVYNCVSQAFYSYLPALKEFRPQVRVIHFIGKDKPWHHSLSSDGNVMPIEGSGLHIDFLRQWWACFQAGVRPLMSDELRHEALPPCSAPPATLTSGPGLYWSSPVPVDPLPSSHASVHVGHHVAPPCGRSVPPSASAGGAPPFVPSYSAPAPSFTPPPAPTPTPPPATAPPPAFAPAPAPVWAPASVMAPTSMPPPAPSHVPTPAPSFAPTIGEHAPSITLTPSPCLEVGSVLPGEAAKSAVTEEDAEVFEVLKSGTDSQRAAWERGEPDYLGKDRFENILIKLNQSIAAPKKGSRSRHQSPRVRSKLRRRPRSVPVPSAERELEERKKEDERREKWESGHIDYTGEDRFDRIRKRLDKSLKISEADGKPAP